MSLSQGFSTKELKVATSDGRIFRLLEAFTYTRKDGRIITVPVGSESNGASSPRFLWRALPPFGAYWMATFLHDHLYECGEWDKDFCAATLLEAMEWLDVSCVEAHAIYEGVHLLGWPAWSECREVQAREAA